MEPSILIDSDTRDRIIISGLRLKEMHDFISDMIKYFKEKYGPDRAVVLFDDDLARF